MAKKLTQNVNKDKLFNDLPKVNPDKSKWVSRSSNYQACNAGEIVPIYYDEVLPNEKRKITMAMISHTTTPIAPIFNSLYTELRAFVVPIRLCADLLNGYKTRKSPWVKVFGEDNSVENSKIIVPLSEQALPKFTSTHQFIVDLREYYDAMDTINNVFDSLDLYDPNYGESDEFMKDINYLNLAAYELIYQRHYRNENYESATSSLLYRLLFDAYNHERAAISFDSSFTFEKANREKDYFTGMKPFTQKGDALLINIAAKAPIKAEDELHYMEGTMKLGRDTEGTVAVFGSKGVLAASNVGTVQHFAGSSASTETTPQNVTSSNLYADLRSVQGISVEELRLLIKTQELLEKDAMYGSLYAESLNAHFGCCPLDLTLQDPQELYRTTITSNMQAIFQTSSTSGESSILGTIGANSTTQTDPFVILPETTFKEHSIIMICAVHKLQNVYDSSWFKPKFIFKNSRFDFYTPELNDLGYQPVTNLEMVKGASSTVGFNEAFAEYRFKFNKLHGILATNFPYWAPAIGQEYTTASALYKESPGILDKALSVRSTTLTPQFYDAWGFEELNEKPMSLHSIPGMDGVI